MPVTYLIVTGITDTLTNNHGSQSDVMCKYALSSGQNSPLRAVHELPNKHEKKTGSPTSHGAKIL